MKWTLVDEAVINCNLVVGDRSDDVSASVRVAYGQAVSRRSDEKRLSGGETSGDESARSAVEGIVG